MHAPRPSVVVLPGGLLPGEARLAPASGAPGPLGEAVVVRNAAAPRSLVAVRAAVHHAHRRGPALLRGLHRVLLDDPDHAAAHLAAPLPDHPPHADLPDSAARLRNRYLTVAGTMAEHTAPMGRALLRAWPVVADAPADILAYLVASGLPVAATERQDLLENRDAEARLQRVEKHLADLEARWSGGDR